MNVPPWTEAPRPTLGRAAATALLIELLLLGSGALWLSHASIAPGRQGPAHTLTLTLDVATRPAPHVAQPKTKRKPTPRVHPQPHLARAQTHPVLPKPVARSVAVPAPKPITTPPPPTPPPAAPPSEVASSAGQASALSRFAATVRSAVQTAVQYPIAAAAQGLRGRTQVSFVYADGRISDVQLVISSGSALLDRAALEAVQRARYPAPPHALAGQTLPFLVWVQFYAAP